MSVFDLDSLEYRVEESVVLPPETPKAELKMSGSKDSFQTIKLFPPTAAEAADAGSEHGSPPGSLSEQLNKLKDELLRRMDMQEMMLHLILRGERPHDDETQSQVSATVSEEPSEFGQEEEEEPVPVPEIQKKATRPSFTPQLFSTFTDYDLALQEKTDLREAVRSRALFAMRSVRNGDEPLCAWIVKNNAFDMFAAFMVVTNCIFLGVEVEMGISMRDGLPQWMMVIGYIYSFWFLLELLLRVGADGCRRYFCGPDWLWSFLDAVVVLTSMWEVAADIVTAVSVQQADVGEVAGMSSLKAFRIVRITRVLKVVRLMRVFRFVLALRSLISSIAETLKSLFWALCLLGVIIYVFAVLFTQAVNDHLRDPDATPLPEREREMAARFFPSLGDTMLSLFESIANGVSWNEVLAPLKLISPVWVLVYLFYIFFTYFTVLNVVTAVFCQAAVESAQNDHAAMVHAVLKNKKAHLEKLKKLFSNLEGGKSGFITFKMLEERMNDAKVRAYFEVLGLDIHDAWTFFKQLDGEKRGEVTTEDFLMGCLRLRGQARAIDMGKVIHDQAWMIRTHSKFQVHIAKEFRKLRHEFRNLVSKPSKHTVPLSRSPKGSPSFGTTSAGGVASPDRSLSVEPAYHSA